MAIVQSTTTVSKKEMKNGSAKRYLFLSFCIPILFLCIAFVLEDVHPFGNRQILVTDFWHQYYPFLRLLHEKLQNGSCLLYTWNSGMGTNFLSIIAYYAASPLNLLTVFVPEKILREAVTALVLLKIGFAGFFFAYFLKGTFYRNDFSLCLFSVMYALCSYVLGYYWNIIWLDTIALLPLVMLGLVQLVRDGTYRLYVVALAISLFSNFYIGMFTCFFSVIAYICLCVFYLRPHMFLGRSLVMLFASVLGGTMGAVLLLPAYYALQLTYSADNIFPTTWEIYENWRVLLANLISFHEPTTKDGLPNLACGVFSLILVGPFLRSRKIRVREKIAAVLVLTFLLVSCNCNVLDYIWHGFHFPNMLPARFSFLFSFVLVTIGYRAFLLILEEQFKLADVVSILIISIAAGCTAYGIQSNQTVIWTLIAAVTYVVVIGLYSRQIVGKRMFYLSISVMMAFELFENTRLGTQAVSTSDYESYPSNYNAVETLLKEIDEEEDDLFYRTEMSSTYTLNDPALYGYSGLSQFSSMVNVNVTKWMRALGLPASEAGNRYYYGGSTPITNMFSSVQYLICRSSTAADTLQWENIATASDSNAYQNRYALPIGFCTTSALESYVSKVDSNPFENQNTLFQLATGITESLFTAVSVQEVTSVDLKVTQNSNSSYTYVVNEDVDDCAIELLYDVPQDTALYGYVRSSNISEVVVNQKNTYSMSSQSYIFFAGEYEIDETTELSINLKDDVQNGVMIVYVYALNTQVLQEGYEKLLAGGITLTSFSDTKLTGDICATEDGLCYFSIPYEEGWTAQVDGVEMEISKIGDAMMAIPVTAGKHTITLSYSPNGFRAGACLTIGSILLLLTLHFIEKKRKNVESLFLCLLY